MKKLAILLLFFSSTAILAQAEKQLVGKWEFVELAQTTDLDKDTNDMAAMIFKGFTLDFSADKKVVFSMMGKSEGGTWSLSEDQKKITVKADKGSVVNLPITKISDSELIVSFENKGAMKMKKVTLAK